MNCKTVILVLTMLSVVFTGRAQNYSADVESVAQNGNNVVLRSSAMAEKKKDAELLALKSAIHAVLVSGVTGLKDGIPMVTELRNDYLYRLMNDNRYLNFIVGKPETAETSKIGGLQRATVIVAVNIASLKDEVVRNGMVLNPVWNDNLTSRRGRPLNPVIVIVPYTDGTYGYSFEGMRELYEGDPQMRYLIDKVAASFGAHGYKTYDFITILEDSKTSELLREGTQTDEATMIVQQLPGDIIVTVESDIDSSGGISEMKLRLSATEKNTGAKLASHSFSSGRLHTTDGELLASHAVDNIQKDFFKQLDKSFDDMVAKGREFSIDMNLSESVDDWDFSMESPEGDTGFMEALENWVRENSMHQTYNMDRNTDKYIRITLNVPLWDMQNDRPYSLNSFAGDLRNFLSTQLGDYYRPGITMLGQKMMVIIE